MVWSQIPAEHIALEGHPDDPSAAAVILHSFGNLDIGRNYSMVQEEHHRVKVFREAGYDLATIEFDYFPGRQQRLELVEGQTFVPDGAGGLQRVPLQPNDVFRERVGNREVVRFTLPALQPGAIFEYRIRITSDRMYWVRDWQFQNPEPTLWSEFRARMPSWITLNWHAVSSPDFHIEDIDERSFEGVDRRGFRGEVDRAPRMELNSFRWAMKDVPALREEPYVASYRNHAYGLRLAYAGYYERQGSVLVYKAIGHSWEDVSQHLLDDDEFGRRMRSTRAISTRVGELTSGAASDEERAQRIYDFVRRSFVWSGEHSLYAARPLDEVLESRRGSSAEINLLLITMLREAGVSTDPILVSTRTNGEILLELPSVRQLNHVIARIRLGSQARLLDATDRHLPMGTPSLASLNRRAIALEDGRPELFRIEPPPSTVTMDVEADVHPDGRISGIIEGRASGYPALELRHRIEAIDETDPRLVVDERGRAFVEIDGFRFTRTDYVGLDDDGEVTFELEFETDAAGRVMEHLLTLAPIVFGRLEQNPFQVLERSYPVDYSYPLASTYVARFTLPEGYEVDDLPPAVRLATERNGLTYGRMINFSAGTLQVRRIYGRRATVFQPHEYEVLREVHDGITAADNETVVLIRSAPYGTSAGDAD